jgi:glycopeptide antibiotics resistance protein
VSRRLWALFALFILYGTTIPFDFDRDPDHVRQRLAALPWNPLIRTDGRRLSIPDAVQNVMLFMPFGVLGGLAGHRRIRSRAARAAAVTGAGLALSIAVETLQLLTVDRVAATSDVVTNGLGALVGVTVADQVVPRWAAFLREHGSSRWMTSEWTYPALSALAVLLVFAWQPFDFTLDVGEVGSNLRALYRDPWQSGALTDEGSGVILYALATVALTEWFRATGIPQAWLKAVACAAVLAMGLELSQALVGSRTPAGSDAAVRLLGVAVGACLVPGVRGSRHRFPWLALLLAACVASAVISTWSPFQIRDQRDGFAWFPLLGFVLATVNRGRSVVVMVFLVTSAAAVGTEYGQSWFAGRHADVTDVAFFALGGVLGAWLGGHGARNFERARSAGMLSPLSASRQRAAP